MNDTITAPPTAGDLDLAPAAVLARAADIIERQGKATDDYYSQRENLEPRDCPVCVLAAIAIACGFEPYAWETADYQGREFRHALAAADALIDFFGLDPEPAYDDSVGFWSDSLPQQMAVSELRAAARGVAA
jgi:hypothetical protein